MAPDATWRSGKEVSELHDSWFCHLFMTLSRQYTFLSPSFPICKMKRVGYLIKLGDVEIDR